MDEEGPGMLVILILFLIQYWTILNPGSEISVDPESEIRAIIELNNSWDNFFNINQW